MKVCGKFSGVFSKKVVIADNCAVFVDYIFTNYSDLNGSTLLIGAIFFSFQIYGDFSGYSDIAIGTAKLFGFKLKQNFAYPYFSRDIAEFWRRWHISLSTWFRDYLYIPLGGSRVRKSLQLRNIFIIFLVSGFWHGANWTFIVWGLVNAALFVPLFLLGTNRANTDIVASSSSLPSLKELFQILFTFLLTTMAWIFFRSDNLPDAINYIGAIVNISLYEKPNFSEMRKALRTVFFVLFLIFVEWNNRHRSFGLSKIDLKFPAWFRYCLYILLATLILLYSGGEQSFIYFQF